MEHIISGTPVGRVKQSKAGREEGRKAQCEIVNVAAGAAPDAHRLTLLLPTTPSPTHGRLYHMG